MLTETEFECKYHHVTKTLSSHIFLNIHQSKVDKTGDKTTDLENMIDDLFYYKDIKLYCKWCQEKTMGEFNRNIVFYPKTLIVVVDRMNFKGELRNLISSFPNHLDLSEHCSNPVNPDLQEKHKIKDKNT